MSENADDFSDRGDYFYLPGKILHIDGDNEYLNRCLNFYKKANVFAVGDEDQCIYSFRGSKPEYMVSFDKIFENGKKHYLSINYRSRKNIVE